MPKFTKVNKMKPYEQLCFLIQVNNALQKLEPDLTREEKEAKKLLLRNQVYWNIHNTPNPVVLSALIDKIAVLIRKRCDEIYKNFTQENLEGRNATAHWTAQQTYTAQAQTSQTTSHADNPSCFFNANGIQGEDERKLHQCSI